MNQDDKLVRSMEGLCSTAADRNQMNTEKPMEGTWTLTAPDGRTWQADSPLRCEAGTQKEHREVALAIRDVLVQQFPEIEPALVEAAS